MYSLLLEAVLAAGLGLGGVLGWYLRGIVSDHQDARLMTEVATKLGKCAGLG